MKRRTTCGACGDSTDVLHQKFLALHHDCNGRPKLPIQYALMHWRCGHPGIPFPKRPKKTRAEIKKAREIWKKAVLKASRNWRFVLQSKRGPGPLVQIKHTPPKSATL